MAVEQSTWRDQDGTIVGGAHPIDRWIERCPEGWEGYPIRAAWREAVDVSEHIGNDEIVARYHRESGMVLLAKYGFLESCGPLDFFSSERTEILADTESHQ